MSDRSGSYNNGVNQQGNYYSSGNKGAGSYHYTNDNGSYYYNNSNGSTYYNSGSGYARYESSAGGSKSSGGGSGSGAVRESYNAPPPQYQVDRSAGKPALSKK